MPHRTSLGLLSLLAAACTLSACHSAPHPPRREQLSWRHELDARAARYGHRNIIAIVDSAYPSQSKPGVEMIVTGEDQLAVVREVLRVVGDQKHVRPSVFTDAELASVAEADAPGISAYRSQLNDMLKDLPHAAAPHEKIIATLDETSQTFNVLLLKTNLTLPYTSVFIRLECGYWSDDAEQRLRAALGR